ncbi:hypothetical protein TWF718_008630 [Orbilia javanica]|uniref:F-box domain-containing protein n=1 Tax=Orbilia javanica TaxID=47235 RepID=A0AAN8MQQ3_9PEZI
MNPPPRPSLETLPPELLSHIILHLPYKYYIHPLLLTSKRLYHIAYPHIWESLESNHTERFFYTPTSVNSKENEITGLHKLSGVARDVISNRDDDEDGDVLGFRYLRNMLFWPSDLVQNSAWAESGLFEVICGQIEAGNVQLRRVEFILDTEVSSTKALGFLTLLKEHSKTWSGFKSPHIRINIPWSKTFTRLITENFRMEDITYLRIRCDEDFPSGATGQGIQIPIDNIKRLTSLLKDLPSLEELEIHGPEDPEELFETRIEPLIPSLTDLQTAILGLKKLKELSTSTILFHPSFFVPPPENLRRLIIAQEISWEWWHKFSQYRFPRTLEQLTLDLPDAIAPATWNSPGDIDAQIRGNTVYNMKSLGLTSLRKLQLKNLPGSYKVPSDFCDLLLENNPGLDEASRRDCELARFYTNSTFKRYREEMQRRRPIGSFN